MGFTAHVAGAFADVLFVVGLIVLGGAAYTLLAIYVPPLRVSGNLIDLTTWALLLLYGTTEIFFAAFPGKWLATLTVRAPDGSPAPRGRLAVRLAIKYSPLLFMSADAGMRLLDQTPFTLALTTFQQLAAIAFYVVVAGSFLSLFPARRTLHDAIAGTALFSESELRSTHPPEPHGFEVQPLPRPRV
jgi:uncharacterized RDD family membrane protein YckC